MRSRKFGRAAGQSEQSGGDEVFEPGTLDAVECAASVLCKRWKPALLYLLGSGHQRYNALARRLPATTPKMLTQQLRELERDGLLLRVARSGGPRHVEYRLTPMGDALRPVVEALAEWGRQYQPALQDTSSPLHSAQEREVPRDPARPADGGRAAARRGTEPLGPGRVTGRAAS